MHLLTNYAHVQCTLRDLFNFIIHVNSHLLCKYTLFEVLDVHVSLKKKIMDSMNFHNQNIRDPCDFSCTNFVNKVLNDISMIKSIIIYSNVTNRRNSNTYTRMRSYNLGNEKSRCSLLATIQLSTNIKYQYLNYSVPAL